MTLVTHGRWIVGAGFWTCILLAGTADAHAQRREDQAAWTRSASRLPPPACRIPDGSVAFAGIVECGAFESARASRKQASRYPSFARSFRNESIGGALGSIAGLGIGLLLSDPGDCDNEDLQCILERLGIGLAASAGGAATGTLIAGHLGRSRPSAIGAGVGAITGVAAGVGVTHLLSEDLDVTNDGVILLLAYALTHGITTALGSRVGAWLRREP